MNKFVLLFPGEPFWPPDAETIHYVSKKKGHFVWIYNLYPHVNKPILAFFSGSDFANEMEGKNDEQTISECMQVLHKMYGNNIPLPIKYLRTQWRSDPFSLGSYTFRKIGSSLTNFEEMAEPIDSTIFFAGESTHVAHYGTVHGAYLSGLRESKRILKTIHSLRN